MAVLLVAVLVVQLRSRACVPWVYWLTVVLVSVVGTQITDALTDKLDVSLCTSTAIFAVLLATTFAAWSASERTLSVHTITTRRRELFYWAAILFTFALGTAAGDLAAEALVRLIDDPFDQGVRLGDAGVERPVERSPDALVRGIVEEKDARGLRRREAVHNVPRQGLHRGGRILRACGIAPHGPVGDEPADVGMPREDEGAGGFVTVHGAAGAQVVEQDMRVGPAVLVQGREFEQRRQGLGSHLAVSLMGVRWTMVRSASPGLQTQGRAARSLA